MPSQQREHAEKRLMDRAIALARRGIGLVEPNPPVGCVIARGDRILGEGYHRRYGGAHAEVEAIRRCTRTPKGATAYVTLEPCCHTGKTPPCVDALVRAGIAEVIVGIGDPFPQVAGRGIRFLRRHGVRVRTGVCRHAARELTAPYRTRVLRMRPYAIGKWAQSLDGRMATASGDAKWISSPASRQMAHRLRSRVDGILVGVQTVLADDPMLTARQVRVHRVAARIVLDTRLRIPISCRLVRTARRHRTIVFCAHKNRTTARARRLERAGVEVKGCRLRGGRPDPLAVLQALGEESMTNLMIEGGAEVLSAFLRHDLLDEIQVFTAPILIGGPTRTAVQAPDAGRIADARGGEAEVRRIGTDTWHRLRLTPPP